MVVDDSGASGTDVNSGTNGSAAGSNGAVSTVAPAATASRKRRSDTNGNASGGAKKRNRNGVAAAIDASSG